MPVRARKVEAQFADPRVWRFMRHTVKAIFPSDPSKWLPERPMRRSHYLYGRSHYLADPEVLERRHEVFVEGPSPLPAASGSSTRTAPARSRARICRACSMATGRSPRPR